MKQTLMTIAAALLIIGCKKKDDTTTTPTTSPKAILTVTKNTDNTLKVVVDYTDKNAGSVYSDDAVRLYINDTFTRYNYVTPKDADYTYTFPDKFTGTKYVVYLERYVTSGTGKDTIATVTGN